MVALLAASDWAEFKFIRDTVGLTDSALSKQLAVLEDVGYVRIRKAFVGKRPRTWAKLTASGRNAFEGHVLKLQEIVSQGGLSLGRGAAPSPTPESEPAARPRSIVPPRRRVPLRT